jgi:hypothetical protein
MQSRAMLSRARLVDWLGGPAGRRLGPAALGPAQEADGDLAADRRKILRTIALQQI